MKQFNFIVSVQTDTIDNAMEAIARRLGHDDDYGFEYTVEWTYANWIKLTLNEDEDDSSTGDGNL